MDFKLTDDQEMLVDAAKKISERHMQPLLASRDRRTALSKQDVLEILSKAADIGLTSARIPEDGGGMGMKMLDYGLVMEQMSPTVGLIVQPHEATTTRIYFGGSHEQKERFVPGLMQGMLVGATGSTEPDCGSDPRGIKTTGEWNGDDIVVNGRKQWISNSTVCDVIHITCRLPKDGGGYRMGRVLVDRRESAFDAEEVEMHGLCQAPLGEVSFNDCRVPASNICPDDENTAKLLTITWLANRPAVGLMAVNQAQKALDLSKEYVGVRKQFGKHIGAFQAIQLDLADLETLVMSSRLLCYNALSAIDHGARANGLSAMAKRYAVDACDRAIALAMRIHGAMGLSAELGLEQMARDVKTLSIPDGTPGILALIQGRELTGTDAFRS